MIVPEASFRTSKQVLVKSKGSSDLTEENDNSAFLFCSPAVFVRWWLGVAFLHIICITAYALFAYAYIVVFPFGLTLPLSAYGFALDGSAFLWIAAVYVAFAVAHGVGFLWMVWWSTRYGRLAFGRRHGSKALKHSSRQYSSKSDRVEIKPRWCIELSSWLGLISLRGKYFHHVFTAQEAFEILLQTAQAYRLSRWVSHLMINHTYVILTVINCWSTILITTFYRHDPAMQRLLCRVWDMLMDVVSAIGVPVFLLIPYVRSFDSVNGYYPFELMWDNTWVINAMNEYRIIVVTSWWDLVSVVIFSILILECIFTVKTSVRVVVRSRACSDGDIERIVTASRIRLASPLLGPSGRFLRLARILFGLWGLGVIVAHTHAITRPRARHCHLQVYPWLQTRPACSFVRINCVANTILGSKTEVRDVLNSVTYGVVLIVDFRHCPALEIPDELQELHNLIGFSIYKSMLVEWSTSAALLADTHPSLTFVHVVLVDMPEFPLGLRAGPLPPLMNDLEFAATNLSSLPENLDSLWSEPIILVLDNNSFAVVPDVVVRLRVPYLSFVNNHITEIPRELLEGDFSSRWFNGNPLHELPDSVIMPSKLINLHLEMTNLASLPTWMEAYATGGDELLLGGSPVCEKTLASGSQAETRLGSCERSVGDMFTFFPFELEASLDDDPA